MKKPVRIGSLKGLASYVPDLLEPMTEEELKEWGGDPIDPLTQNADKIAPTRSPSREDEPK
ncbi:hypothetical protein GCM10017322_24430 [Paracoccus aerius]|nr:hypothetical protein GCM10017322_24430 [Paracoccus aerius]